MPKKTGIAADFRIAKSSKKTSEMTPRQKKMRDILRNNALMKDKSRVVSKATSYRTGKTNKPKDYALSAKPAGYRISRNGKLYYEGRVNRSDGSGRI